MKYHKEVYLNKCKYFYSGFFYIHHIKINDFKYPLMTFKFNYDIQV